METLLFLCCNLQAEGLNPQDYVMDDKEALFVSLMTFHARISFQDGILSGVGQFLDVFAHVSMCASVLVTVAFTFERHFAICSPHQYRIHIR